MVITYNPGPLRSSPGLMLKRLKLWKLIGMLMKAGSRLSGAWRRLKGPSEVCGDAKFLSLRVEAFHNSIALTDHVVVFAPHHWRREEQLQIFQLAWAQVELTRHFYFTATLGTDIFFIDTNCLLLVREHREHHRCHCDWRPRFALERLSRGMDKIKLARACNILLTAQTRFGPLT
jgi:hypothetical protein